MRRFLMLLISMLCVSQINAQVAGSDALESGVTGKVYESEAEPKARTSGVKVVKAKSETDVETKPLPMVSPTKITGTAIVLVWLSIFSAGMCALCGVQTPLRFEEKGIMMSKEY